MCEAAPVDKAEKGERLVEAGAAVLSGFASRRANVTVLQKVLFYTDLFALRDTGETVTRSAYIALPQGPVVSQYEGRLIRPMTKRGIADQIVEGMAKPIVLKQEPKYRLLSASEVAAARDTARAFDARKMTSAGASKLSHENPGWMLAWSQGLGGPDRKPKPINMVLAMQQILDADSWLDVQFSAGESEAFDAIETEEGEPW
jgi:hypothetical protein